MYKIKLLIYLLALLSILSVNIYLPAMPVLQSILHTSKANIGLTISFYMLGLAIGIPFYGAVSDHVPLKKVIAFGIILFILANTLAMLSSNIFVFITARALQGLSAASALCLWQVITFKHFAEKHARHIINSGFICIGAMPAIAPILGGVILSLSNWRVIFITLTILSFIILLLITSLPKQSPKKDNQIKQPHIILSVLKQYQHVLLDVRFLILTLASASIYIGVYVYLTEVPFLLYKLGYTAKQMSLFFIPISIAFITGGLISKSMLKRHVSFIRIFTTSVILYIIAFLIVMITKLLALPLSGWMLAIPFFVLTIGSGIGMPNVISQALSLHPKRRGTAASMIGLIQNSAAFLFSSIGAYLTHYGYAGLIISYAVLTGLLSLWFVTYLAVHFHHKIHVHEPATTNV
ncbi:MFS transporter [Facilibium subflavum]|uniref:MFS transporter n=1 Tax=Facilibium subflavum TaxID=2219058 RepID=UPI000E64D5BA|nr:MFS transporter [Facilibium subflavum]